MEMDMPAGIDMGTPLHALDEDGRLAAWAAACDTVRARIAGELSLAEIAHKKGQATDEVAYHLAAARFHLQSVCVCDYAARGRQFVDGCFDKELCVSEDAGLTASELVELLDTTARARALCWTDEVPPSAGVTSVGCD